MLKRGRETEIVKIDINESNTEEFLEKVRAATSDYPIKKATTKELMDIVIKAKD